MSLSEKEKEILKNVNEAEAIDFLKELVTIDSQNPPGNERAVAEAIEKKLKSFGCKTEMQTVEKNRPNIIGIMEGESRDKILFNGHTDTVKIGDLKDWKFDPLGAETHDGKIYGRGAADMKAGLVSMIYAMKALRDSDLDLKRGIMFTGVIDEEVFFKGTKSLLKENKLGECIMGYVSEPTNVKIVTRQKGGVEFIAKTYGKEAHTGMAYLGKNAIYRMNKVVSALEKYNDELKKRMNLPVLRYPTVNVGVIRGGTGITFVPDHCEIEFDRQVLPGESISCAEKEVFNVINEVKKKNRIKVDLRKTQEFNPWEVSKDEPVVKELANSYAKFFGRKPNYHAPMSYCEVELLASAGIPSVVFGPGELTVAHRPNEYVKIQDFINVTKIYTLLAYRLCCMLA